jgi:predicted Zn-dependent protease
VVKAFNYLIAVGGFVVLAGCGGRVSPTDQSLIRQAEDLHTRLRPAVVEERDPKLKRYFEQIASRITEAAQDLDRQGLIQSDGGGSNAWMFSPAVDFHLVKSDLPNGFASGGNHVYLYTALFDQCRTEDELAAVLCHQYAHLYERHVQQSFRRDPLRAGEDALLFPFATMRHTVEQERAADRVAFGVFARAGWDPGQFASVYQRMLEQNVAGVDRALLREMVIEAQRRADALPPAAREWAQPPVADEARFPQLQAEAKSAAAGAGAPAAKARLLLAAFSDCLNPDGETAAQAGAAAELFPPPPAGSDNKWGKGLQGR